MTQRHKVFISYYHEDDQYYRDEFERLFSSRHDIIVSKSVNIGDIDPNDNQTTESVRQQIRDKYIRDATVIVVLVGARTWQRKYVDWEIYSGLRDTKKNPRCGLLGIILPSRSEGWVVNTSSILGRFLLDFMTIQSQRAVSPRSMTGQKNLIL